MGAFLRKYATATAAATHVGIPMIKAGSNDFATGADWSPSAGDVKVSIDGGAQANIATLPTFANGQWLFALSVGESTGKRVVVVVVDSATKAVEDQMFVVETFGHASAMYQVDYSAQSLPATVADKAGYSLAQAFPANFAALGITTGGKVSGVVLVDSLATGGGTVILPAGTVGSSPTSTSVPATMTGLGAAVATGDLTGRKLLYQSGTKQGFMTDACSNCIISGSTATFVFAAAQKETPAQGDTFEVI